MFFALHFNNVAGYTDPLLFLFERTYNHPVDHGLLPWRLRVTVSKVRSASGHAHRALVLETTIHCAVSSHNHMFTTQAMHVSSCPSTRQFSSVFFPLQDSVERTSTRQFSSLICPPTIDMEVWSPDIQFSNDHSIPCYIASCNFL